MDWQDTENLESLIDAYSLETVLATLADICGEKSEHVSREWQDKALAREWIAAARAINSAAAKVAKLRGV